MHPNCNCRTGILDEDGNIAFYLEDVLDKLTEPFDFSENKDNAAINKLIEEIQQKFAQLFDFSKPWERRYEENNHKDFVKEISEEEVLFLSKLQMIGVPFDLSLEILSEMRRTKGNIPKEKYKKWGFADSFSIGYAELQYKLTQEGMTIEQMDFLASNASLLAALDISLYNLAAASVSVAGTGVVSDKFNKFQEKLKSSESAEKIYFGKSYNGTRNPAADFKNAKGNSTLSDHFNKHGSEYTSPEAYKNAASNFLEKPPTKTTQTFISVDGTYFRYDIATNEFGIINKYGGISTYFKPDLGIDYWLEQIDKYTSK